jgi:hypothetical protein
MPTTTADYLVELYYSAAWNSVADSSVLEASGDWQVSGNRNNAISFGDDTDTTFSARFISSVWANLSDKQPVRYTTTMSGDTTTRTFTGVVTKMHRTLDDCDIGAEGMKVLIAATKIYSPMFVRRPVATKTTASSIEDPTNGTYKAGLINYALWTCGGRPNAQSGSYPSAIFYYDCDHAILAPDYSWLAGEDSWAECLKLAQAAGGQMYQDASGVVRFKQVLGYAGASATDNIGMSDYATIEAMTDPSVLQGNKWTCQYTPRRRLGTQQVADDTTPRHVEPGESVTIVIEPQNPLVALETATGGTQLLPTALIIATQDGGRIAQGTGYTHTLDFKAARATIVVTNAGSKAFTIWRVVLRGDPVVATESGSVSSGSGTTERQIEPSVYIQRQSDAQRLAEMCATFYALARANVTVTGCVHKPSRFVGQTVNLSCTPWSMTNVAHVILSIKHDEAGIKADYELANVSDLPDPSLFFIVGTSYSGSDVRYLGW